MVFMNEMQTAGLNSRRAWQHGACAIQFEHELAAAAKSSGIRLAAQLAVSVQRVRAQRGPAPGLSLAYIGTSPGDDFCLKISLASGEQDDNIEPIRVKERKCVKQQKKTSNRER